MDRYTERSTHFLRWQTACAAVLCLVGACAGLLAADDAPGVISGSVSRNLGGDPISSISVVFRDIRGEWVASTTTGVDGLYSKDLDAGSYYVCTSSAEYLDELYDDLICELGCFLYDGTPVTVTSGVTTSGIDLQLDRLGSISGTVSNASTGEPIPSLRLRLTIPGSFGKSTTTDAAGQYSFVGLDPGGYRLYTDTGFYSGSYIDEVYDDVPCVPPLWCNIDHVSVTVGLDTELTGIDLALDPGGSISGTVRNAATGQPMRGYVYLWDEAGSDLTRVSTNNLGFWQIDGLPDASYFVIADYPFCAPTLYDGLICEHDSQYPWHLCDATAGTPVVVAGGGITAGIDIALHYLSAISGLVSEAGTGSPIPEAEVSIYDSSGELVGSVLSDANGLYTLDELDPGTYFAVAESVSSDPEVYDDIPCFGCDPTTGTAITVAPGATVDLIDFSLEPASLGAISGTVRRHWSGNPEPFYRVIAWEPDGGTAGGAYADSSGAYQIDLLPPGSYYVYTDGGQYSSLRDGVYDGIICSGRPPFYCDPTKGTPVTVTAGQLTTGIDLEVAITGSAVLASVSDQATGEPLAGVHVDLWDAATAGLVTSSITGPTGNTLVEVSAGTYLVSTDNDLGYIDQVYDGLACPDGSAFSGSCDPSAGAVVSVLDNRVTDPVVFALDLDIVFSDGFEQGDTSRWSVTVP